MKNIHILPSKKPSRLIFDKEEKCFHPLQKEPFFMEHQDLVENRNLYITSDEEVMNGYAYYPELNEVLLFDGKHGEVYEKGRQLKVTLTTDQDLIKDGVQEIPDKFLNWFVKNPSCEEIEIKQKNNWFEWHGSGKYHDDEPHMMKIDPKLGDYIYEIIIPKEESKHSKVLSENGNELFFAEDGSLIKETLEEAVENYCSNNHAINEDRAAWQDVEFAFKDGAEWQMKRSQQIVPFDAYNIEVFAIKSDENGNLFAYIGYKISNGSFHFNVVPFTEPQQKTIHSEEDLLSAFEAGMEFIGEDKGSFKEWFENFKKKQ